MPRGDDSTAGCFRDRFCQCSGPSRRLWAPTSRPSNRCQFPGSGRGDRIAVPSFHWSHRPVLPARDHGLRRRSTGLRRRRRPRCLSGTGHGSGARKGTGRFAIPTPLRREGGEPPVPQHAEGDRQTTVRGCDRTGRPELYGLRYGRRGGRLQQRRLSRPLRDQLRLQHPVPEQWQRNLHGCHTSGRRAGWRMEHERGLRGLRQGWLSRPVCGTLPRLHGPRE